MTLLFITDHFSTYFDCNVGTFTKHHKTFAKELVKDFYQFILWTNPDCDA